VSNEDFVAKHKSGGADSPEVGKEIARKFMTKVRFCEQNRSKYKFWDE
jgi:hypothetical protein